MLDDMKTHRILSALAAMLAVVCLSGCGSPVERRVRKDPAAFSKLNEQDKAAVMAGTIREPRPAPRFSVTPAVVGSPAPRFGEHSDEIAAGLGFDAAALRSSGVIH